MTNEGKEETFPLFQFKNKETHKALRQVITQYEGVLPEAINTYLEVSHHRQNGQLLIKTKNHLLDLWWKPEFKSLSVSEFKGLIEFALLRMELEILKKSDEIEDFMIKADKMKHLLKK